jgi:hypothetical protein
MTACLCQIVNWPGGQPCWYNHVHLCCRTEQSPRWSLLDASSLWWWETPLICFSCEKKSIQILSSCLLMSIGVICWNSNRITTRVGNYHSSHFVIWSKPLGIHCQWARYIEFCSCSMVWILAQPLQVDSTVVSFLFFFYTGHSSAFIYWISTQRNVTFSIWSLWVLPKIMTKSCCCFWKCDRNSGYRFC